VVSTDVSITSAAGQPAEPRIAVEKHARSRAIREVMVTSPSGATECETGYRPETGRFALLLSDQVDLRELADQSPLLGRYRDRSSAPSPVESRNLLRRSCAVVVNEPAVSIVLERRRVAVRVGQRFEQPGDLARCGLAISEQDLTCVLERHLVQVAIAAESESVVVCP